MNEQQETATLDTDALVNLAVNIRAIEYTLRKSIEFFRKDYRMSIRYRCDEFDVDDLNGCGIIFDLFLHNRKTDYKDVFSRKFYYSDILLNEETTVDIIANWFDEIVEIMDISYVEDDKGE